MRLMKSKFFDERSVALVNSAFYMVKPPQVVSTKPVKVLSPVEAYLKHLLLDRLEATEASISFVSKQLLRLPWSEPSQKCGALVCKYMLKACRKGRYKAIGAVAGIASKLKRFIPEAPARLIDGALEELRLSLEHPNFRDQQRIITYAKLLGEMYRTKLVNSDLVLSQLYNFINSGHEIPKGLREASSHHPAEAALKANVSRTIYEDEEMEEAEEDPTKSVDDELAPVPVTAFSKFDPRVPCAQDSPNGVLRIKLVCTLLESCGDLVRPQNLTALDKFLAAFQRYLFTKSSLPAEVEFSILDTFDSLDSQWKKAMKKTTAKSSEAETNPRQTFTRYHSWKDAHLVTAANEEADAAAEERYKARLKKLAGLIEGDEATDALDDGSAPVDDIEELISDGSEESASDTDSDDETSVTEPDDEFVGEEISEAESSDGGSEVSDDASDEEEEDFLEDDEELDEAAAQDAYMRQLEAEAFERELRKVTMEALEKGKVASRAATGGKVADNMVSGSHFIKKQPSDSSKDSAIAPVVTLGGQSGISFNLLKRGNKGKVEAKQLVVPADTNLAKVATKHDDEAARERDLVKAAVLRYEAESAEHQHTGGNLYLAQPQLQVIRNRPLSMEDIDRNFGSSSAERPQPTSRPTSANRGNTRGGGRGRGRLGGGRTLFH